MIRLTKRNGQSQLLSYEKLTSTLQTLCYGLTAIDVPRLVATTCTALEEPLTTAELDVLVTDVCFRMANTHTDYGTLANRLATGCIHKTTNKLFSSTVHTLYSQIQLFVSQHLHALNGCIIYNRDYDNTFLQLQTLQNAVLQPHERPQHMHMRVACWLGLPDVNQVIELYNIFSKHQLRLADEVCAAAGLRPVVAEPLVVTGTDTDAVFPLLAALASRFPRNSTVQFVDDNVCAAAFRVSRETGSYFHIL